MKKYFLIVSIFVFLTVFYFIFSYFKKPLVDETLVRKKMDEFLSKNPNATKEYARDVAIYEIALEKKDKTLCKLIKDEYLYNQCKYA